jgi:N6-adenosine-specific RNA methylase IME4
MPSPSPGNRPSSVIHAPRREHSRKPDEAYELIETAFSRLPKIELFARETRAGWAAWGNEIARASRARERELANIFNAERSIKAGHYHASLA